MEMEAEAEAEEDEAGDDEAEVRRRASSGFWGGARVRRSRKRAGGWGAENGSRTKVHERRRTSRSRSGESF